MDSPETMRIFHPGCGSKIQFFISYFNVAVKRRKFACFYRSIGILNHKFEVFFPNHEVQNPNIAVLYPGHKVLKCTFEVFYTDNGVLNPNVTVFTTTLGECTSRTSGLSQLLFLVIGGNISGDIAHLDKKGERS